MVSAPARLHTSAFTQESALKSLLDLCVRQSCVQLYVTPWTVAQQALLSVGFSRQEYWSGSPFPSPGDLAYPEIELSFLASSAVAGGFFTTSATWEADMLAFLPLLMILSQLFQVRKSGIFILFFTAHHLPNLVMFPL